MNKLIVVLISITVVSLYFAYVSFQHSTVTSLELKQLKQIIAIKEGELIRYNAINKKALSEKQKLQNNSTKIVEKLNETLSKKESKCANEHIDKSIADKLYKRATDIRSAT